MRSFVHRLLLGIGLMMVAGCVLPNRSFNQSGDARTGPTGRANSFASNRVSFKRPAHLYPAGQLSDDPSAQGTEEGIASNLDRPTANAGDSAGLQAGHSIDLDDDSAISGQTSSRTGSTAMTKNTARPDRNQLRLASDSQTDPIVPGPARLATQRTGNPDQQSSDNFVHLQGVEFDASEASKPSTPNQTMISGRMTDNEYGVDDTQNDHLTSNIPNWNDRQADDNSEKSKRNRPLGKPDQPTASQTGRSDTRQNPAMPNVAEQLPALPWQSELEKLIARAEQDVARTKPDRSAESQSEYLRRQAHLRLLYLMSQRQQEALTAIPGIDPSEQEFWQHMLLAMSNSFDTNQFPDSSVRAAQTVAPLSAALREIRDSAPLAIKNMGFCRKISYFGNYERFPRNEFTPGQEVLLYTEIENFVSSPTSDGEYRTSLKSLVEIVDPQGKVVWTKGFAPTEDFCRNPRRDYFHNYQFHIPKDLSTGTYSLKLTIEDELSHKRISNSLNFLLK